MPEVLFACVVAIVLPARAWRRHRRGMPAAPAGRYLAETLLLIGTLAALLARNGVPLDALGLPDSALQLARDTAVCVGVIVGLDAWSVWRVTRSRRRAAAAPAPEGVFADALAGRRAPASFVAVTAVGAVWEELCFRATVFLLVPHTTGGLLLGIAAGSLLFGAQHLRNGPAGLAWGSFFGVLFSILYLATGDLVAVIVAHAAGNLLAAVQWAQRIQRARRQAIEEPRIFIG